MAEKIMMHHMNALVKAIGRPVNDEKEELLEALFAGFLGYNGIGKENIIPESLLIAFLKSINKDEFFVPVANVLRKKIAFYRDDTFDFDEWCRMYARYYCDKAEWSYDCFHGVIFRSRETGEVIDEIGRH